jgi:hypothetical protein
MEKRNARRADSRVPEDSPSGADPSLDDPLEEKERELEKMTRNVKGGNLKPPRNPGGPEDNEGLIAQAIDPEAQES